MKNFLVSLSFLVCLGPIIAQVPQAFNYQGIARDANGAPIINTNISIRITLKEGGTPGLEVYKETHFVQTNKLGLFSLEVGRGTSTVGVFQDIHWGSNSHFILIEIDPAGGSNFISMGAAQLLAVPYALYAGSGTSQWQDHNDGIHYNGGNVGIGTDAPQSNLSIEGSNNVSSESDYISVKNTSLGNRSGVTIVLSAGDDQSNTSIGHHSETYNFDGDKYTDFGQVRSSGRGLILRSDDNNSVIKFLVGNTNNGTILQERMRITATGNVGIGTETPVSKLQVTDGDVYIENISNGVIMKSPNGNCWRVTVQNDGTLKTTSITCPN